MIPRRRLAWLNVGQECGARRIASPSMASLAGPRCPARAGYAQKPALWRGLFRIRARRPTGDFFNFLKIRRTGDERGPDGCANTGARCRCLRAIVPPGRRIAFLLCDPISDLPKRHGLPARCECRGWMGEHNRLRSLRSYSPQGCLRGVWLRVNIAAKEADPCDLKQLCAPDVRV